MKKIKLFICVVFVTMFTSLFSGCATIMPIPEIKEGRFDFSVTCEINGEEKTKTKTMIVEELLKDINSYLVSNNKSNDDKFHFL